MSFLDNSGDIILDAVLTDIGRKRMAAGNFTISKFALGDDEINYQLYNKAHPSGSAYYDLEIMQTPVLEPVTMNNAINYGLMDITNLNLLYMPAIKTNPQADASSPSGWTSPMGTTRACYVTGGVYLLAANLTTYNQLTSSRVNSPMGVEQYRYRMRGDNPSAEETNFILFETGIDNNKITATQGNRTAYLDATNMMDNSFTISANELFIASVYGLNSATTIANDMSDSTSESMIAPSFGYLTDAGSGVSSTTKANFNDFSTPARPNGILGTSKFSVIQGPRGTVGALQFMIAAGLGTETGTNPDQRYYDYGKVAQNLYGDDHTYDYIDTVVFVKGDASSQTLQLPVRIIRQNT